MTTLNARANQAWRKLCEAECWDPNPFYNQGEAYEHGWETGYKTAAEEFIAALESEWQQARPEYQPGLHLAVTTRMAALNVIRGAS